MKILVIIWQKLDVIRGIFWRLLNIIEVLMTRKKMDKDQLKRTIETLRQEQEATRGAMDWMRLEEEIQELLDEGKKDG